MAEKPLERESLTCPICLDLLLNPVTIPCGHSFCMRCIENSWRSNCDVYHCPQCRKRFSSQPVLNKNIMLADLVEQIVKTTPASDCYGGPQDVTCDVCTGRKLKAVKSCLQCVVSFCDCHLQPHRDVAMLQKHQLVAPSNKLQENICHEHNEVKKLFCRTDLLSICLLCCMDQHKDHDTVCSADERALRQAEMEANIELLKNRVHHKEADQNRLSENNHASTQSAKRAELYCSDTFTELIDSLTNIQIEVNQHITSQLRTEKKLNNILRDELRRESSNLTKTISELEELAGTKEHNHFLLLYSSAPLPPPDPTDAQPTSSESTAQQPTDTYSNSRLTRPPMDFDYVIKAMTAFREKFPLALSNFKLPQPEVPLSTPEPVTRKALLCYRRKMELDQNTAHSLMFVSDEDRRVTFVGEYPQHPNRFIYDQVLSKHGMIGRSYWEVQMSRAKFVCVAVSYKDFEGGNCTNECPFGNNDKSWALMCDDDKYSFCCNSVRLDIAGPAGSLVGVYLDYVAGVLSFYDVDRGIATLLHKVQTSFTQPVYAGLALRHHCDSAAFEKI